MQVYIVCGGCVDDHHIIAVYRSAKKAEKRVKQEIPFVAWYKEIHIDRYNTWKHIKFVSVLRMNPEQFM